ncbi:response regulator [Patescibacteria group bacterium]|nr:response regulator [Patescibacteria group bacterium]
MNDKKLILIIDDEPDVADALSQKLELEGFNTISAYNGEQGLMIIRGEPKPDLILLDLVMPTMDGFEMLDKLREEEWGRNIPVIFLTNLDDEETVSKVMKDKGYEYLIKTEWKIEDIVSKIKKKLG